MTQFNFSLAKLLCTTFSKGNFKKMGKFELLLNLKSKIKNLHNLH